MTVRFFFVNPAFLLPFHDSFAFFYRIYTIFTNRDLENYLLFYLTGILWKFIMLNKCKPEHFSQPIFYHKIAFSCPFLPLIPHDHGILSE